ncbi:methyltransferase [Candidatus Woesearchaeota archaeon]|nr:methyltransferase [Candidatus Woesearchaeota archaeon]
MYEPAEDSFLLKKHVERYAKGKVLDVGTGSGILALAALKKTKDVLAVDINAEAVEHAKKEGVNAKLSDLFSNVKGKFDLIIFNPPYLPEDEEEDKESKRITTGGKKGSEISLRFLKQAKKHLAKEGKILIVASSLTGNVEKLVKKEGYNYKLLEAKKIFFEELRVYLLSSNIA